MNKIYLHAKKHIYLSYFNDEIIVLDLKKNNYIILSKDISAVLFSILKIGCELIDGKFLSFCEIQKKKVDVTENVDSLRQLGLFSRHFHSDPYPKTLEKNTILPGAANIDWRLQYGELDLKTPKKLIWQFYFILVKVHFIVNVFGFKSLINRIKRQKKTRAKFLEKPPTDFRALAIALNRACFYFPFKTKCLEWAAALTFMGLRKKWQCNTEIGVQTLPFAAHAWVNVNGTVVGDISELPQNLAVILSEPF